MNSEAVQCPHLSFHVLSCNGVAVVASCLNKNAPFRVNRSHIVQSKDMCGEPARSNDYATTWQHSVVLTGLEPGEHYTYRVGDDPATYSFTAAPPVGSGAKTSFIMYGDMGVSSYDSAKAPG
jgi:Purple acid Phosphatase, N-terminal domain